MQASHRVAMNTGILYARMAITILISLYTTRVILNALGTGDFGIFNIVGGAIAMLTFLNASMAAATQRFMSVSQGEGDFEKQKDIFNVSIVLHALVAGILIILLEGAGWVLFHGVFKIEPGRVRAAWLVYQFAAVSTLFTIISVPYDAVINARENMLVFAVLGVIESVLKLIVALLIVRCVSDKLVFYGFWMASASIFLMLLRVIYCHAKYDECVIFPKRHFKIFLFKEMTGFAGWSFLGNASSLIAGYSQGIIMNAFFGSTVNAAQGVANQVSGQLGALGNAMLGALNPLIGKSEGAGDRSMMLSAAMMGSKISFLLLVALAVPISVEMPYIFAMWLKNIPEYAVAFCQLLLLRSLIAQLFITLSSTISAVGNIRRFQAISSCLNLAPMLITYFLFRFSYSPMCNYLVYIAYTLLSGALMLHFVVKDCGMLYGVYVRKVIFRCVATFAIVVGCCVMPHVLLEQGIVRLFTVICVNVIVFFPAVWYVGFALDERKQITMQVVNAKRILVERVRIMFLDEKDVRV